MITTGTDKIICPKAAQRNILVTIRTFVGAALIGVVENGLYAMAFPYYSINIIKGLILLLALIMSAATAKAQD